MDIKGIKRFLTLVDLDLPETLRALGEIGFEGMAAVELSRDSHRGAEAATEAMAHLRSAQG